MSQFIRKLFARVLTGGACLLPLGLATDAQAQPGRGTATPPVVGAFAGAPASSESKPMTAKELHQHLARGAGWIRIFDNNGVRHGTGWILDRDRKLMVTNNHVVDGYDTVTVTFPIWKDGKILTAESAYLNAPKVKATVIDRDPLRDLALIQVEAIPDGMHALKLAANEPDEGDEIRLIGGFTNGGDGLVWGAVSGVVRACGPQELDSDKRRRVTPVREVLSDARTNGGNSGAPVVNTLGEVVAVHFAYKPWATGVVRHVSVIELKTYLKEALPLVEPKSGEDFLARAKRRMNTNRLDAASADASAALAKNPKLAEAMVIRGRVFLAKNDPQTALEDFNEALSLVPESYDTRIWRGRAHRAAKHTPEALADFSAAIRSNPALWTAYNERGLTYFFAARYYEAESDFGRAITASPKDPVLRGNRADALARQEKFAFAAMDWSTATELAPGNAYYPNGLGLSLLKLQKYEAAAEAFALAVNASNGAPLYLGNMAEALRLAGKHDLAIKGFTKAIDAWKALEANGVKFSPVKIADDLAGRAQSRIAMKQYKEATDDLTKALDLTDRKIAGYFLTRADAYEGLGETAAAEADRKAAEALGAKRGPAQKNPAAQLAGVTWVGSYNAKGLKFTEVVALKADGTFQAIITISDALDSKRITDTGTWSVSKNVLTINGKVVGKVVREFVLDGEKLKIEVEEIGQTVTYFKHK